MYHEAAVPRKPGSQSAALFRQRHYCLAIAVLPPRKTYFWILPVAVFGSSSTKVTPGGALKCARCAPANSRRSSAVADTYLCRTTRRP